MLEFLSNLSTNLLYLIFYSVISACAFWACPRKWREICLLLFNIVFYTVCCKWYVLFILFAGVWSWYSAKRLDTADANRKGWLWAGIVPLVLILCTFKYWTPLTDFISGFVSNDSLIGFARIALPLGMSYYILKSISYLADVYNGKIQSERNLISYLTYVSFFAQIIAGPIQRYSQWKEEINRDAPVKNAKNGYYHIVSGLFMKVVIANRLGDYVMGIMNDPVGANGVQLWIGFFLYAVYIYCDFAGYSHIAIGITNFFGLDCIDNFKMPYLSRNIKEFWNRWHISLSTWLRDYIYIPLGGNRKGEVRRIFNLMVTFLVSGMWHGSTWNFVVWGGYHGALNALTPKKLVGLGSNRLKIIALTVLNAFLVAVGWIFFATPTISAAGEYFKGMVTRLSLDMSSIQMAILPITMDNTCIASFGTVMMFIVIGAVKEINDRYQIVKSKEWMSYCWQIFMLTSILLFGMFGKSSFIYAGF